MPALSLLVLATGCHRREVPPDPAPSAVVALAPVPAPAALLLRGELRNPGELYKATQALVGGRARLLPTSLAVAIATTLLDSPLSSGMIDDTAPAALAVMGDEGRSVVTALRLTSGRELVAALTMGSDARFTATKDAGGVTLLAARSAPTSITLGVFADHLILGESESAVLVAGPFVATNGVAPSNGTDVALVAPHAALAGPIATGLAGGFASLRDTWLVADAAARKEHGGRTPDFGDPAAVVRMASAFAEQLVAVLGSAEEARLDVTLTGDAPLCRGELVAGATGRARELTDGLAVGDLEPVRALPGWVEAALFGRASDGARDAGTTFGDRLEAVLGDRLKARERERVRTWVGDALHGIGPVRTLGVFGGARAGIFIAGTNGDGDALRRATLALPAIASAPAFAEPLHALLGKMEFGAPSTTGTVTRLPLRLTPKAGSGKEPAVAYSMESSSVGARVAVIAAQGDGSEELQELLSSSSTATVVEDATVASAIARAGKQGSAALVVRVRTEASAPGSVIATVGSDRKVTWAEVGASKAALAALVRAFVSR
ncbi:MAG TPA: hypothetical protein VH062_27825 [Polyangiaceae bacterium]|nr:hypothetical protein [Polyangiaceae bacterium]